MRYSLQNSFQNKAFKQSLLAIGLLMLAPLSMATTWTAGSSYKGKVTVPIEGGPVISWNCNGKQCSLTGPWGEALSMDSCQNLALRVGKLTYYQNSAGKVWSARSAELAECNQVAR